jgi:hypothetical protein
MNAMFVLFTNLLLVMSRNDKYCYVPYVFLNLNRLLCSQICSCLMVKNYNFL